MNKEDIMERVRKASNGKFLHIPCLLVGKYGMTPDIGSISCSECKYRGKEDYDADGKLIKSDFITCYHKTRS
jgi:hypothetical protein